MTKPAGGRWGPRHWSLLVAALAAGLAWSLATSPAAHATFPGANGRIAFLRDGDIYTVRADGSKERRLTRTGDNTSPAWSPDGQRIAFSRGGDVYVMRANGDLVRQLTDDPGSESDLTWSPSGKRIAFHFVTPAHEHGIGKVHVDRPGRTVQLRNDRSRRPPRS